MWTQSEAIWWQLSFNSMKVRLKHAELEAMTEAERRFNSMKVRLKLGKCRVNLTKTLFQFHEGPIKTSYKHHALMANCGFNSMKVRLKRSRYAV